MDRGTSRSMGRRIEARAIIGMIVLCVSVASVTPSWAKVEISESGGVAGDVFNERDLTASGDPDGGEGQPMAIASQPSSSDTATLSVATRTELQNLAAKVQIIRALAHWGGRIR